MPSISRAAKKWREDMQAEEQELVGWEKIQARQI